MVSLRGTPRGRPGWSRAVRAAKIARVTRPRPILLIDNYDSFTMNVADLLGQMGADVVVRRNDAVTLEEIEAMDPAGIVVSPGPGRPEDAGVSVEAIRRFGSRTPVLGICLGHQAIATAYGGRVVRAVRPLHGTATDVRHRREGLLRGVPSPFRAARYHSLVVDPERVGKGLRVTARSAEGEVMAMRHGAHPVEGVQFHPESYLTPRGPWILAAFLRRCGLRPRAPRAVVR
jgi:anthranilate synthase/aminodeoxychorismate synthase-like glutamine amidotransferase